MPYKNPVKYQQYQKNYRETHKNNKREYFKTRRKKLKLKAFEKLGNKCANSKCPIPIELMDIRCLQIDHINGGGHKEYLKFKTGDSSSLYLRVLADKEGKYQLLCAYCNWLKRIENKEYL